MEIAIEMSQSFAKERFVFWIFRVVLKLAHNLQIMPHLPSIERHWGRSRSRQYPGDSRSCYFLMTFYVQMRTFLNLLPSSEADYEKFTTDQPLEVIHAEHSKHFRLTHGPL